MSTPVKPDITPYLEAIENAVYGEEVRGSIHDAIEAVNNYADEFYTDAQEQAQAAANSASSASGYATTASTKAGEASASATAAGNAETAAKNAKTDAVDAKNLANEYAGNAASSAAQAAASAQAAAATGPILIDTVGWMCKNRVPLTLESLKALNTLGTWTNNVYTRNDVDFTVNTNSDGYVTSIVMNGTASGFASLTLLDDTIANLSEILPQGNYIVNGCPDGGAMLSGYSMRFKVDTETYYITDSDDMTVAVSGSSSYQVTWSLACTSGTSVSSKTFKPMIRKSAIADNTFEAYHKSVEDWYWENNAKTGVHNYAIASEASKTASRVTYTYDSDDGSVDAQTTAEGASAAVEFFYTANLKKGTKYRLSGCPANGSWSSYLLYINGQDVAHTGSMADTGDGCEFTIDEDKNDVKIRCFVASGAIITTPITFKPVICLASDTCGDYVKGAMTNTELTEKVVSQKGVATSSYTLEAQSYLKKKDDVVYFNVAINSLTITAGTTICTFPSGYRPSGAVNFVGVNSTDETTLLYYIDGNGNVVIRPALSGKNIRLAGSFLVV